MLVKVLLVVRDQPHWQLDAHQSREHQELTAMAQVAAVAQSTTLAQQLATTMAVHHLQAQGAIAPAQVQQQALQQLQTQVAAVAVLLNIIPRQQMLLVATGLTA